MNQLSWQLFLCPLSSPCVLSLLRTFCSLALPCLTQTCPSQVPCTHCPVQCVSEINQLIGDCRWMCFYGELSFSKVSTSGGAALEGGWWLLRKGESVSLWDVAAGRCPCPGVLPHVYVPMGSANWTQGVINEIIKKMEVMMFGKEIEWGH